MASPHLMTVKEAARRLGVTPMTVYRLVRRGILRRYHVAGGTLVLYRRSVERERRRRLRGGAA